MISDPAQKVFKGWANATFSPNATIFDTVVSGGDEFAESVIFTDLASIIFNSYNDLHSGEAKVAGINPYIYCQNTENEVHLSKFTFTGFSSGSGGGSLEDFLLSHYLTTNVTGDVNDIKYRYCPSAIDIPDCDASKFTPTPESTPVYKAYPKFVEWVESNGEKATDWYATTPLGAE